MGSLGRQLARRAARHQPPIIVQPPTRRARWDAIGVTAVIMLSLVALTVCLLAAFFDSCNQVRW